MRADRLPILLLAVALVASAGFHAYRAAHPTTTYQSADERSYGKLAVNLVRHHDYGAKTMVDPLHWPPGAPLLFAAAHRIAPDRASAKTYDIPAAYWAQALVSLMSALLAALLAGWLAGRWAAFVAGAAVGLYPPLILASGEQTSEPLGACLVVGAFLAFAIAAQSRRWAWFTLAGAICGAAVLTRADLLPTPLLLAGLVFVWGWRGDGEPRRALGNAAALAAGFAVVLVPWTLYASDRAEEFVPVTRGSSSALFVGTYLPGGGNTVGMKRDLAEETWRRFPKLNGTPGFELPARAVLQVVADRHPELDSDAAIALEGRKNLVRYGLKDPLDFTLMMLDKGVQRMWSRYARGGARHTNPWIRAGHILLVLFAFSGVLLGVFRQRSLAIAGVLLAVLVATGLHALLVSQARYNLPLMPALGGAGTAGWFRTWSSRRS